MKLKLKIKLIFWSIVPITFGIFVFYCLFSITSINLKSQAKVNTAQAITATDTKEPDNPQNKYYYTNKDDTNGPKVSAKAFLVGDLNTGEVILSQNQNTQYPIASLSKLMTALVTNQITDKDPTVTVTKQALATEGTNGGLYAGEKISTSEILYPLLLESSNDAAEAIAEHFGHDSFISKMNTEAQNLKMDSTSYEDPSGLSKNNISTVSDLFKLAGYLNKNDPDLISITDKKSFSSTSQKQQSWYNINHLVNTAGYFGGKTGYTDAARQTIVSLFNLPLGQSGTRPIAITLLSSPDRAKDVATILKYLNKNIYYGGLADANTNWVEEKVGAPNIKDPDFVDLTFAGDIMLDRGVKNSVRKNFNNDYSQLFAKVNFPDFLKDSDVFFANLEGPASDQGTDMHNLYSFRMDPNVVPALAGVGVDVLSVANNHVGDWGRDAYADTLSRLKENEIQYAGGGNNETEAETPVIIEKYGMKIGYLAFSDKGPDWMAATTDQAGLLLASNPRFDEIIQNAAKQVDDLVVSFHFGEEYQTTHNARQELLAHKAVDDGAKLVIGAHPHVPEDTEVYKNSYIAYSLGNFIFDQSWSPATMQGMILNIKLGRDGSITAQKDTVKLNSAFQLDQIIKGTEEKVKFQTPTTISQ